MVSFRAGGVIPSGAPEARSRGIETVLGREPSIGTSAIPRLASLARNDTSARNDGYGWKPTPIVRPTSLRVECVASAVGAAYETMLSRAARRIAERPTATSVPIAA